MSNYIINMPIKEFVVIAIAANLKGCIILQISSIKVYDKVCGSQ